MSKEGLEMKRFGVLLVGGVLLVVVAVSVGQVAQSTKERTDGSIPIPSATSDTKRVDDLTERTPVAIGAAAGTVVSNPTQQRPVETAKEKTVEELLNRLDALKAQQEELDKAKKETVAALKEKLKQQKERLQKLGVNVEEEVAPQRATSEEKHSRPLTDESSDLPPRP
jgi:hypothetical protein